MLESRMEAGCLGFGLLALAGTGAERRERRSYAEAAEEIPKKFPSMEGYAEGGGWSAVVTLARLHLGRRRLLMRWLCSNERCKPPRQAAPATPP